jgi:SNF2 family DNA or RNA helicase
MNLTKTTSFAHQAQVIQRSKDSPFYALFMEQGTGKTHVVIATMTHLFLESRINCVVMLSPNGIQDNWARNELPTHCILEPDTQMEVAVWHSSDGKKKRDRFIYQCTQTPTDRLLVILANIEALRTVDFTKIMDKVIKSREFMAVVDESTIIKNPKAMQTKAAIKLAKNAKFTRIMTGTPITQSPLDVWSQCLFLSPLALPYPSWTAFKAEYAIEEPLYLGPNRPMVNKIMGYKNQPHLSELLAKFSTRILKRDCLDLPDKVYRTRYIEMTDDQRRVYTDLVKTCLSQISETEIVTVNNVLTMLLRCHTVALGYVSTDTGTLVPLPSNRLKALEEEIEASNGHGSQGIIFVRFKEDVRAISNLLREMKIEHGTYCGNDDASTRHSNVERFQEGYLDWLICTSAAARGLTLTAAENVIYYSQGHSLEIRLQSEDRAHRIGQKKTVVYTDFVTRDSVDESIIAALKNKSELANSVLDHKALRTILEGAVA